MASVHEALLTCPDITGLDLRVSLLGCSNWPDRFNFPFKLEGGDKYPALKELRLEGYRFLDREFDKLRLENQQDAPSFFEKFLNWVYYGRAWRYAKYLYELEPEQRNKTNLDLWMDAMDWSQLESLGLIDTHIPADIAPRLQSLRKLELQTQDTCAASKFISGLRNNSLTHLTHIGRPLLPLNDTIVNQSESLEYLELRDPERLSSASAFYENSDLTLLSHMVPKLSHLSINLHRNDTWPLDTLEIIASIPPLRTVDLWLDITSECRRQKPARWAWDPDSWIKNNPKCTREGEYQTPLVDEASCLQLFKLMRDKKKGEPLQKVVFWVGDWSRGWDGPIYIPDWLQGKRAKVVCSVEGKQEGEAWCVVESGKEYWKWSDYDGGYDADDDGLDDERSEL